MTLRKSKTTTLSAIIVSAFMGFSTYAHERFMIPTHTMLSGESAQKITVTASISNDIFHPDRPLGDSNTGADVGNLKTLFNRLNYQVISPKGNITNNTRWQAFARMSVADVPLEQAGTYRIALVQPDVHMVTFKKSDGSQSRIFGKSPELPDGATDIIRRTTSSRVETYVSFNEMSQTALKPVGTGIELGGESHPNDLFAGETANFQLFYNGKPLNMPAKVKVIKGGTRHRNNRNEQEINVNANGKFSFTPPQAGFYFLSASSKVTQAKNAEVDVKHYSLYATLEVFPE